MSEQTEPALPTATEMRQVELIRKLQLRNKAREAEARRIEARQQARKQALKKAALGGVDQVSSRLFQSKRQYDRVEDHVPSKPKPDPSLLKIVRRVKDQGPDPRHAAFLEKLSSERRKAKEEAQLVKEREAARKKSLAETVRSIGQRVFTDMKTRRVEVETKCPETANDESETKQNEESKGVDAEDKPVVPSVYTKHKQAMVADAGARLDLEKSLDRSRWEQRQGIDPGTPVFICSSGYPAVRNELLARGWYENPDKDSEIWDFYFSMKMSPFVHKNLRDDQITNRFFGTGEMCSKAGIAKNLRMVKWFDAVDPDSFFPRCYNLGTTDKGDQEDFVEDFKVTETERVLFRFRSAVRKSEGSSIHGSRFVVKTMIRICTKFLSRFNDDYVDNPMIFVPPVVSDVEWAILSHLDAETFALSPSFAQSISQFTRSESVDRIRQLCKPELDHLTEPLDGDDENVQALRKYVTHQIKKLMEAQAAGELASTQLDNELVQQALGILEELVASRGDQGRLNGGEDGKNVWIVKPAGKSRGRGIECFDNIDELFKYTRVNTQETTKWVVQKYMENALIVHKRKFDIRQWVLVTNWNPLTIYFYDDCYLRFCVEEYSLDNLNDRFIHLANNSISKHSERFNSGPIKENMWRRDDFIRYMDKAGVPGGGRSTWYDSIKPALQEIVRVSMACVQDLVHARPNSFEVFGFDFMIDDTFKPWLIEINSSPSMEYSTAITQDLAQRALTSAIACVLDGKYKTMASGKRKLRSKPATEDVASGDWEVLYVSPHEFRRKMEGAADLNICGKGIPRYNRSLQPKRFFVKPRRRQRRAETRES